MTTTLYDGTKPEEMIERDGIFWFIAANGVYMRRPTLLGNIIVPHRTTEVPEFPAKGGMLDYSFDILPAKLVAQTHDWFRRIFAKYATEAEVLLAYNPDAQGDKVRIFVPIQKCSHGGVHSAYDPTHLARGWQVIGSIHSHCDFSAFHSGTDTNDASEFDGLHITMGHVNTDTPSMDAMVAMNKVRWSMKLDEVADRSELNKWEAPEWWDRMHIERTPNAKMSATFEAFRPPPPTVRKTYGPSSGVGHHGSAYQSSWKNPWSSPPSNGQQTSWWQPTDSKTSKWTDDDDDLDAMWGDYLSKQKGHTRKITGSDDATVNKLIEDFATAHDALVRIGIYPADLLDDEDIYGDDDPLRLKRLDDDEPEGDDDVGFGVAK